MLGMCLLPMYPHVSTATGHTPPCSMIWHTHPEARPLGPFYPGRSAPGFLGHLSSVRLRRRMREHIHHRKVAPQQHCHDVPASRNHAVLAAMGRALPSGFLCPLKCPSSRKASSESSPDRLRSTSSRLTSRAATDDWQAAQIISNVHPETSAAVPRCWPETILLGKMSTPKGALLPRRIVSYKYLSVQLHS